MGKNVAVFVDVANIFYAAKAAGTDIDYVTLLQAATAGRDFVRAYAYTGLDPDNENQRNFHAFLARNHYKVVSKDIRKYGDGKVKANLDIELVVDLMKTARNLDIAIVISGDGDFAPAIRAVQEMGVRVEVISFRGNTSSDLIEVADLFTDITQLARVDKTSSRSGRRVAGDQEDLSMTEVPDKQTEGTGQRGRGGRGRGRGRPGEAEPVAARGRTGGRTSGSRTAAPAEPIAAAAPAGNGAMTVLPGEKLSRVSPAAAAAAAAAAATPGADIDAAELTPFDIDPESMPGGTDEGPTGADGDAESDGEGEAGRRRRRRRGGRGRGRGRGRDGEALPAGDAPGPAEPAAFVDDEDAGEEEDIAPAPRGPRTTPFGSVWDSQIGTPTSAPASLGPVSDDEDFDEPEIPGVPDRRAATRSPGPGPGRSRLSRRPGPWRATWWAQRLQRRHRPRALRPRRRRGHQPLSGRQRTFRSGWPARRPAGRRLRPAGRQLLAAAGRTPGAAGAALERRPVERRPAGARGAAARPAGPVAEGTPPGAGPGCIAHRSGRRGR